MSMKCGVGDHLMHQGDIGAAELSEGDGRPSVSKRRVTKAQPQGVAAPNAGCRPSSRPAKRLNASGVSGASQSAYTLSPISQRRHVGEADLGWAAGVMDGEGCIHIARQTYGTSGRRPTYRLRLNIAQNDEQMLREFSWVVGVPGRIYSPKPTRKQNKTCHCLVYDGVSAFAVLERLHKHLRRKQAQATLAAEFRERCDIHRHTGPRGCPESLWELREWYYERMSGMKRS